MPTHHLCKCTQQLCVKPVPSHHLLGTDRGKTNQEEGDAGWSYAMGATMPAEHRAQLCGPMQHAVTVTRTVASTVTSMKQTKKMATRIFCRRPCAPLLPLRADKMLAAPPATTIPIPHTPAICQSGGVIPLRLAF
jgi:hypothetical protein